MNDASRVQPSVPVVSATYCRRNRRSTSHATSPRDPGGAACERAAPPCSTESPYSVESPGFSRGVMTLYHRKELIMTATTEKTIADELRTAAVRLRCEHSLLAEVPERLREPLAALLDQIADDMADKDAIEGTASKAVHPVSDIVGLLAPRADWTAALAVARLMNGGDRG